MGKPCVPCLGEAVKTKLVELWPALAPEVSKFPDCTFKVDLKSCVGEVSDAAAIAQAMGVTPEASSGPKEKRPPSIYNLFVKDCIAQKGGVKSFAEAPVVMKACALAWKTSPKNPKAVAA